MDTAARLKALIGDNDKKQIAIAHEIGIASSTLSNYVTGASRIPGDIAAKLAVYFHITTDYILCLTDTPERPFDLSKEERALVSELRLLDTADRQFLAKIVKLLRER